MTHAGQKFDLQQMQEYFETEAGNKRCISDYHLSESDYKSLGVKLKGLFMLEPNQDWLHEFILPITIYSVYSLIYDVPEELKGFSFHEVQKRLSQYQMRQHIQNMLECIHDFGFLDFGYGKYDDAVACRMSVARHAGIPNDEKYEVFELISGYQGVFYVDDYVAEVTAALPAKSKRIFSILDEDSRRDILLQIHSLLQSCKVTSSRQRIMEDHPGLSITLVDYCIFWSESQRLLTRVGRLMA